MITCQAWPISSCVRAAEPLMPARRTVAAQDLSAGWAARTGWLSSQAHSAARSATVRFRSPTRSRRGPDELRPDLERPGTGGFSQDEEACRWSAHVQTVWDAIMAGNQAMLDYLQREADDSRTAYHGKDSGRFADAHEWVITSFAQHTGRDNDPQLHVHNAILNRVLSDDPLAPPSRRPAHLAQAGRRRALHSQTRGRRNRRTDVHRIPDRPTGWASPGRGWMGRWKILGISEALCEEFSPRRRAIEPRLKELNRTAPQGIDRSIRAQHPKQVGKVILDAGFGGNTPVMGW